MNELTLKNLDSDYIHRSQTDLNFSSSKSNTTNTSSSSNSLAFNEDEEDDDYIQNKKSLSNFKLGAPTTSSSANSINNHISNSSQLITSLTSSLIREDPRSSSSSTTSSSNESNSSNDIFQTPEQQQIQQQQLPSKHVFLLNAFVNGFAQLKLCADRIDFEYIIEVYWSDESRTYVKRTYDDFVTFHKDLMRVFDQFFDEIKANVNMKALKYNSMKNLSKKGPDFLMPVLPSSRKPFWVSHLKMAETRETALNSYVERLLKLPTKIAHSDLVLKFFASQTSDPKPARPAPTELYKTQQSTYQSQEICMSNIVFDHEHDDNEDDVDGDNESGCADNNSNFEYEDELDDRDSVDQYLNHFERRSQIYNNLPISNSMIGLNHRTVNREAGLWWDEDEALNELTSSMSFDQFGAHAMANGKQFNSKLAYDDGSDDLETLRTLEKMLKTSELFKNENNANSVSSVSSTMIKMSENQMVNNKRLSLS